MNKLFLIIFFVASSFSIIHSASETKKQKIERLFTLTNDKQMIRKVWEPMFGGFNITDEKVKETAIDKYFDNIKTNFIAAYDKFFTDLDIDEMLKYYGSATGKKFNSVSMDLNSELQKAYSSMMTIIQDLTVKPEESNTNNSKPKSTAIIHFDEIAKGRTDAEVRELFNQELKHDGLTVVKFSAEWCGPCKNYAKIFGEIAEQLKEVTIDHKKMTVKYIATDIDATKVIAQDYSVTSIPATIFYKNGKKIGSQTGYMTSNALYEKIKELAK